MTPPLNIFAKPSLTVKFGEVSWVLVWGEGASSRFEVEAGVGALSCVGVEVEGATRVEGESLMAMLCEVDEL